MVIIIMDNSIIATGFRFRWDRVRCDKSQKHTLPILEATTPFSTKPATTPTQFFPSQCDAKFGICTLQ